MLLQMALFHSFLWLSNICVCVCHIFIHSSVFGHLGCFHILAIVNSASMYIGMHVSFQMICLDICPGVRLLDHMSTLFSVF